ncbi:MAG TPA: hypothetical protein VGJ26_11680 [Pirellulales bacterium]|jgi:hypothetical protein
MFAAGNAFGQTAATRVARGDSYYLQRAQIDTAHAADHARLAEEYLATKEPVQDAKEHAKAIRNGVLSARRSHAMLSEAAKKDAEISKKLAEVAAKEKQLLALADRIDPPVVVPVIRPRSTFVVVEDREPLRFRQSYYFDGEGHFID